MITYKNEAKVRNIFHVIKNANSLVQHLIQIKNKIVKYVNLNIKIKCKKDLREWQVSKKY